MLVFRFLILSLKFYLGFKFYLSFKFHPSFKFTPKTLNGFSNVNRGGSSFVKTW